MKFLVAALVLLPAVAVAGEGSVPDSEISLGGIAIGQSRDDVIAKLGQPLRQEQAQDFLDLHYDYPHLRVSFNADIVAGLDAKDAKACTPKGLCRGDGLDRMRALYGAPTMVGMEDRAYAYHGPDGACWLEIPAKGKKVASLRVVCMP